jgi:transcriptional regulator with XRE-family HTH domain
MQARKNGPVLEPVQKRFGRRVRELRERAGLSQERFAEVCGLHRTYIGGIERGERNPSLVNVERIANALGITLSRLFEEKEAPRAIRPPGRR